MKIVIYTIKVFLLCASISGAAFGQAKQTDQGLPGCQYFDKLSFPLEIVRRMENAAKDIITFNGKLLELHKAVTGWSLAQRCERKEVLFTVSVMEEDLKHLRSDIISRKDSALSCVDKRIQFTSKLMNDAEISSSLRATARGEYESLSAIKTKMLVVFEGSGGSSKGAIIDSLSEALKSVSLIRSEISFCK